MPVPPDAADLGHVAVAVDERGVVLELLALPEGVDAGARGSAGAPEADVAVVGAREQVLAVRGDEGGEDALHALGVVDVLGVAARAVPEADAAVVARRHERLARRGEVDVHDGGDVVFHDVEGAGQLAHVEEVDVVVFARGGEVEGFHWVPGDLVGGEGEGGFGEGGGGAEVVEDQGAVGGCGGEDGGFGLVESKGGDCVGLGGPVKGLQRGGGGSVEVVDGDYAGGSGEGGLRAVVREAGIGGRT